MGFLYKGQSYSTTEAGQEARRLDEKLERLAKRMRKDAKAKLASAKRMALADKIVMAVVDQICAAIIRPGPKPEERECYVVAQELRDFGPELREVVASILRIEAEEPPLNPGDHNV